MRALCKRFYAPQVLGRSQHILGYVDVVETECVCFINYATKDTYILSRMDGG